MQRTGQRCQEQTADDAVAGGDSERSGCQPAGPAACLDILTFSPPPTNASGSAAETRTFVELIISRLLEQL